MEKHQPEQVTLVPDDPAQATSDHGWNFAAEAAFLTPIVKRLKKGGFRVSLFSDPDPDGVTAARDTGADRIELYTGPYGSYHSDPAKAAKELERLGKTADAALAAGLQVNAGHDLVVEQSAGAGKAHSGIGRSVDRTWVDSRCVGVWHGRHGGAISEGLRVVAMAASRGRHGSHHADGT